MADKHDTENNELERPDEELSRPEASNTEDTQAPINVTDKRPKSSSRARRTPRAKGGSAANVDGIIQFPTPHQEAGDTATDDAVLLELEAQGFTEAEAQRLILVSDKLATSGEARESETTLRRLRFTRWLVEHGVLDEFSA